MLLNCGFGEDSWDPLGVQGDPTSPSWWRSVLGVHWKDWCWSWNSSTLATWCEELTHLKKPWCWQRLRAGGKGDNRGWVGWMASPTQWTWVWVDSGSWWWTGRPGGLRFMGLQSRTWLSNWTELINWTRDVLTKYLLWAAPLPSSKLHLHPSSTSTPIEVDSSGLCQWTQPSLPCLCFSGNTGRRPEGGRRVKWQFSAPAFFWLVFMGWLCLFFKEQPCLPASPYNYSFQVQLLLPPFAPSDYYSVFAAPHS